MIRRTWMTFGALLGWFALLLQLYLSIRQSMANGKTFVDAAIFYFGFFTILTNLWIALVWSFLTVAAESRPARWISRPMVQTGSALYIATVGVIYSLLLRHAWNPQGWQQVADVLLHDVVPPLFVGYWLIFASKEGLQWTDALKWLAYPVVYLLYSLGRGAITGVYPYPFIDVGLLGYGRAMANAGMLIVAFVGAGLVVVAATRRRKRS